MDINLLNNFMANFLGFGNPNAEYWMIGIEEGTQGEEDPHKIELLLGRYLEAWKEDGCKNLMDLPTFHKKMHFRKDRFDGNIQKQRSWEGPIRTILTFSGYSDVSDQLVLKQQVEQLGRIDSRIGLMELNPLPAPSTMKDVWPYKKLEVSRNIPWLSSRNKYEKRVSEIRLPSMAKVLCGSDSDHAPQLVLLYSSRNFNRSRFEKINSINLVLTQTLTEGKYWSCKKGQTVFAAVHHPNSREKTPPGYYEDVGRMLREFKSNP